MAVTKAVNTSGEDHARVGFGRVTRGVVTLGRYGVNPWVYAGIEIATSGPYGVATARVITSLLDRNRQAAGRWAALGLAMFIAPDLYIVAAGRGMPAYVYVVVSVLVALLGTLALFGVRAKVSKGRVARELVSRSRGLRLILLGRRRRDRSSVRRCWAGPSVVRRAPLWSRV